MVPIGSDGSGKSSIERLLAQKDKAKEPGIDPHVLDKKIEELKKYYEQYFSGFLKKEPVELRAEVAKWIREFSAVKLKNPTSAFKIQALIARYNSYSNMWNRILQDIEEGRYKRDLFKLKIKEHAKEKPEAGAVAEKPASSDPIAILYGKYVAALKANSDDQPVPSEAAFRKKIQAESKALQEKLGVNKLSFSIAVADGKVRLKAKPK